MSRIVRALRYKQKTRTGGNGRHRLVQLEFIEDRYGTVQPQHGGPPM